MKRLALLLCLLSSAALGQPVLQSGTITPNHPVMWTNNGVVQDAGTPQQGALSGVGVTFNGQGICQNSGPTTGAFNRVCINSTPTGASLSLDNLGGATGTLSIVYNGLPLFFPTSLPSGLKGQVAIYPANGNTLAGTSALTVDPAAATNSIAIASSGNITLGTPTTLTSSLTLPITGSTQCLEVNSSGLVSGTSCTAAAPVQSVSNSDGTLTVSPTTGVVVASLALGHANTWTAGQSFNSGDLLLKGATSGSTTLNASATASGTATLPANTGTIAEINLAQSWTAQQTFSPSIVVPLIIGGTISSSTLTLESTSDGGGSDFIKLLTGTQVEALRADTNQLITINPNGNGPISVGGALGRLNLWNPNNATFDSILSMEYNTGGAISGWVQGTSRGATPGAHAQTLATDPLLSIYAAGDTAAAGYKLAAQWLVSAAANFTGSSTPTQMQWSTVAPSTTTLAPALEINSSQAVLAMSPTGGFGYASGLGVCGTVTQLTSKSTGVTLNNLCGQITMNNASLANAATVAFAVGDSTVGANDAVVVWVQGGTSSVYRANVSLVSASSFTVSVQNSSGGPLSEAVVIGFTVLRGAIN